MRIACRTFKRPVKIEVFSITSAELPTFYLETMRPVIDKYGGTGKVCVIYYEFPLQQHLTPGKPHVRRCGRRMGKSSTAGE